MIMINEMLQAKNGIFVLGKKPENYQWKKYQNKTLFTRSLLNKY